MACKMYQNVKKFLIVELKMSVKPDKFEELSKVVCAITNLVQLLKNISSIGKFLMRPENKRYEF